MAKEAMDEENRNCCVRLADPGPNDCHCCVGEDDGANFPPIARVYRYNNNIPSKIPLVGSEEAAPPGEEEISKPPKEKKRKRGSPVNTPKRKKSTVRKPKADTVALSPETSQCLRHQEEEQDDHCLLVAHERGSPDTSKTAEPVVAEMVVVLHKKAFSKSRAELAQCEAELKKISEERGILKILYAKKEGKISDLRVELTKASQERTELVEKFQQKSELVEQLWEELKVKEAETLEWRQGMDSLASEKETLREHLASLERRFQKVKEESLARGRKIKELKTKSVVELAQAKSDAEAIASSYRADAKTSNIRVKALEEEVAALLSNDEDSASGSDSGGDKEEDPEDEALEGADPGDAVDEDATPE
ncbi:uncharacterized protein [Nicotiana sylvestris]|uniref:uncharacterized protein n=1 Tax=Nicotiana sylvestris TaxID=4096 RepID=UPI00388C75C4